MVIKRTLPCVSEVFYLAKVAKSLKNGRLAQLVERHPYKVDVASSSLAATTIADGGMNLCRLCGLKFGCFLNLSFKNAEF